MKECLSLATLTGHFQSERSSLGAGALEAVQTPVFLREKMSLNPNCARPTDPTVPNSGIAGLYEAISEDGAASTIAAAVELGCRVFDTAPHYGLGLSEERLGRALEALPESPQVSVWTKVRKDNR